MVANVIAMFEAAMVWRQENQVDRILWTYSFPEYKEVMKHYPFFYHGVDKKGHPVIITRVGHIDSEQLFNVTTLERMQRFFVYYHELFLHLRLPACSKFAGKRVDQMLCIYDFSGFTMSTLSKKSLELLNFGLKTG